MKEYKKPHWNRPLLKYQLRCIFCKITNTLPMMNHFNNLDPENYICEDCKQRLNISN